MFQIMNKTIAIIPLVLFLGCYTLFPIKYTYKTSYRYPILTKSDLEQNPLIGIALLSKESAHDTVHIKNGIDKFMHHQTKEALSYEILFADIGPEILIDENRHIKNIDRILGENAGMRYALVLWKNKPIEHRGTFDRAREIKSDGQTKTVYDVDYMTTLSIKTEIVLIDLVDRIVLAKAIREIDHTKKRTRFHEEPNEFGDNFFSQLFAVLSWLGDSKNDEKDNNYYPIVTSSEVEWNFETYVYEFFKNLNEK